MTRCILLCFPSFCRARAPITRNSTRTGATARSAPTNNSPAMDSTVSCGAASPSTIPIASPINIPCTRLIFPAKYRNVFILPHPLLYPLFAPL